jgi:hypothetical protein
MIVLGDYRRASAHAGRSGTRGARVLLGSMIKLELI